MVEALAATVVTKFLLPYVKDGIDAIATKVAKGAGDAVGDEAVSVTKKVWGRVKALFAAHPGQEEVIRNFEDDPDATAVYLTKLLTGLLEADPEAKEELSRLVETTAPGKTETIAKVMENSGLTVTIVGNVLSGGSSITGVSYAPPSKPEE
jgi:hypothetical protein